MARYDQTGGGRSPVIGVRFLTLSLGRLWFEIGALRSARAVFVAHCRIDNRLHLSFEVGRAERLREQVGEHRRRRAAAHVDGSVADEVAHVRRLSSRG